MLNLDYLISYHFETDVGHNSFSFKKNFSSHASAKEKSMNILIGEMVFTPEQS